MTIQEIKKTFLGNTPRKIFYMARWKLLRRRPVSQFDEQHPCVFTLSTGRVGSETLAHLMKLARNVIAYHEPRPELFALSRQAYLKRNDWMKDESLAEVLLEGFRTARREFLKYSLYVDRGYVETGPQGTFLAPLILNDIPAARFIHLVRDPRMVVRSGMRRKWYNGHAYDYARIQPDASSPFASQWNGWDPFQKNLWLWAETNRWALEFATSLPPGKYLLVHSEDMFNAHEPTIKALYDFLDTKSPARWRIQRILGKRLNAQVRGQFSQPDDWFADVDPALAHFVVKTAAALGYDLVA